MICIKASYRPSIIRMEMIEIIARTYRVAKALLTY